jgi:formylglycine-generating enzyme required for sulfatase activity
MTSRTPAIWIALLLVVSVRAEAADPPPEEDDDPAMPPTSSSAAPIEPPIEHGPPPPPGAVEPDGMIRIAAGTLTMGSDESTAPPNERPPHTVSVKSFAIDRTEVTVGAYRACMDQKRCAPPTRSSALCTYGLGDSELPITCVHWSDADAFCRASKKRLPTEAEWELAARGPGNIYPWGNARIHCGLAVTLMRDTTATSCSGRRPARVGTHPSGASPLGVQDLIGNAEEWVQDYYAEHSPHVSPRTGASRVLRGGGWLSWPSVSRGSSRNWGSSLEAGPNVGFRCAR